VKVAVVMPAYQAAAEIGDAIGSVLNQTVTDWQLVVVDDGSTDETAAVAESFADPRVAVVRREHCGLPAAGRNAGIAASSSELVAFLDADDLWHPEKLRRQLALLRERPDVGLVYTLADALRGDRREAVASATPEGDALAALVLGNPIHNSSVVVRRELLERVGPLDEDPALRGTEDYELWLRLACETAFACVHEPLTTYRRRPGGLGSDATRMERGALVALRKAEARSPGRFADVLDADRRRTLAVLAYLVGEGSGRELLAAALRQPADPVAWKWVALSLLGRRGVARLRARRWRRGHA
jgi:cellulose synthase/poly-beta-1,6-N-acetylglucosamine synthase-like glycosyltransferase